MTSLSLSLSSLVFDRDVRSRAHIILPLVESSLWHGPSHRSSVTVTVGSGTGARALDDVRNSRQVAETLKAGLCGFRPLDAKVLLTQSRLQFSEGPFEDYEIDGPVSFLARLGK